MAALGEVSGDDVTEEVLDSVLSQFWAGKSCVVECVYMIPKLFDRDCVMCIDVLEGKPHVMPSPCRVVALYQMLTLCGFRACLH